ncbi:MAG: hypothetical protein AB7S46_17160 [Flavobacteriaceae bacterium]
MSEDGIRLTEAEKRRRRRRSVALALVLAGLVVLFYVLTVVKFGPAMFERAL